MKKPSDGKIENNVDGDGKPEETIEDALTLLKQGKQFEKVSKYWEATDKFIQGRQILQSLAKNKSRETEEDQQIISLYEEKAQEYFLQSRKSLIKAMTLEMERNKKSTDVDDNLTDEEARLRTHIFCTLFSMKVDVQEPEENVTDQVVGTLEERLQELNASLPSGFKTDDERMDSINRGLNRLGLSLYPQKKPFAFFQETLPKSEDEQVAHIMAQAKDEIAFEKKFGRGPGFSSKTSDEDEFDDGDDGDDTENTEDDLKLDEEQLAIKHIRHRVVNAQMKLAELVAHLDEAKSAKEEKDIDRHGNRSDDIIETPSGDTYLASGKKKLRAAQRDLNKAIEEWSQALL